MSLNYIERRGLKNLSILLSHQVRNCLEDAHVKYKISQKDMKALNIDITNHIYSALVLYITRDKTEREQQLLDIMGKLVPSYWEEPKYLYEEQKDNQTSLFNQNP